MKKICYILLLFYCSSSYSQLNDTIRGRFGKIRFGYSLGLCAGYFHLTKNDLGKSSIYEINQTSDLGFEIGLLSEIQLHKNIYLCVEPNVKFYPIKLKVTTDNQVDEKVKLGDISIPLLAKYTIPFKSIGIIGGLDFVYFKRDIEDTVTNKIAINKVNSSFIVGIQKEFKLKPFSLIPEIRYSYSIFNALDGNNSIMNQYFKSLNISTLSFVVKFI